MYLEHVNLVVNDINQALNFYRAAFPHWRVRSQGEGLWSGKPRTWVHFGDDYHYLAFSDNGIGDNRDLSGHQVGLAHFAYVTEDLDGVIQRLQDAGFEVDKVGPENPYRRNVYFKDPTGFEVEFVEYGSDIPAQRNNDL
ncbi:VOC family protein [Pseudoalteromonas sp. MM17-2]|uniref:VOC family protein n=1 Tax=Pseudoalteromonas sp. MM17-2 TaxID=2917753 RepID=UPI001EF5846C|nr:VOC family protein [Pseudoalteromonas sp. MM17-2]MCG7544805.1 VOC family protein [Pseudoalteromonas sp. MM17-2]